MFDLSVALPAPPHMFVCACVYLVCIHLCMLVCMWVGRCVHEHMHVNDVSCVRCLQLLSIVGLPVSATLANQLVWEIPVSAS